MICSGYVVGFERGTRKQTKKEKEDSRPENVFEVNRF